MSIIRQHLARGRNMNKQRPVNLNLWTIKFPIPAIISILHRASGALLFFFLPFLLWMLQASLVSPDKFSQLQNTFSNPIFKIVIWLVLAALFFHLVAGIRHLLMDLGIGESLKAGRFSAKLVLIIAVILMIIAGGVLWRLG